MESNMRRGGLQQLIRPSGGVEQDTITHLEELAGSQATGASPDFGMGYVWNTLSPADKSTKILELFSRIPLFGTDVYFQNAAIAELDRRAAAVRWPGGPDLASDCMEWATLSAAEKLSRVQRHFQATSFLYATPLDYDQTVARVESECNSVLEGIRRADEAGVAEAARVLANTRIQVNLTSSTSLPSDLRVTLSNSTLGFSRLMDRVSETLFELSSLTPNVYTISITGSGLVSRQAQQAAIADRTMTANVVVQTQQASVRVAVVLPPGADPNAVTVTGVPNLSRQPDGSWASTNVPPGRYDVVAEAPGMVQQHQTITLAPGQAVPIGFALVYSPASLTVTVNVPGALVLLDGRPLSMVTPTTFSAAGVQAGEHILAATVEGYASATQSLTLSGGQAGNATFVLTELPPVCPPAPTAWSTEQERTDWIAAHATCPAPTPYCPPLPASFASEAERQAWIDAHSTCTRPGPWVAPVPDPNTMPTQILTPTPAPSSGGGSGLKWLAGIAALFGTGYLVVKRQKQESKDLAARHNPGGRMKNPFKVGDLVKYRAKFLQSTGQYTNVPINGRVESINESMQMPSVLWNDRDEPVLVHPANIMLWNRPDTSGL